MLALLNRSGVIAAVDNFRNRSGVIAAVDNFRRSSAGAERKRGALRIAFLKPRRERTLSMLSREIVPSGAAA